jgi:hypothetical protein
MTAFTLTGTVLFERPFTATVEAETIEEARAQIRANFDADPEDYAFDDDMYVHSIVWD